jgi:tetratricopeptide (TPR) repeat protein
MPKHPVADELSAQLASRFKARADDAAKEMTRSAESARRAGASSTRAYGEAAAQAALAQAAYDKKQFTEAMQHYAQAKRAYDTSSRDAAALAAKAPTPAAVAQKVVETPAPVVTAPVSTPQRPAPTPASTPIVVAATPVAPAPPTPAPKPAVDEDAAVRQIVSRLKAAIEQKDLGQYKILRPDLTADEERRLSDAFRNVASQQVDYTIESVAIDGDKATLKVTRRGRVSGQNVPAVKQTLRLTKTAHGWVITEIGQ